MSILVTGGAGYIGSHTCIELLNCNYDVIVADNLCSSSLESLKRVEKITGKMSNFTEPMCVTKMLLPTFLKKTK